MMAQIIAVWGSPNSGKTTLSVKLSRYITKFRKHKVFCIMTDPDTPSIQYIFANYATSEQQSIGTALSAVTFTETEILKGCVTVEDCPDLLYMGYCRAENINSYPIVYESKAREFFTILGTMADYIIVDCVSNARDNVLSKTAIKMADRIIRLYTPDTKSVSYMESQLSLYNSLEYKCEQHIHMLNCNTKDLFMPVEEVQHQIGDCRCIIPYYKVIKQQMMDGALYMPVQGSKFDRSMERIFRFVAEEDEFRNERKAKKETKKKEKKIEQENKKKTV